MNDKVRIVARPVNDEFVVGDIDDYIILGPLTKGADYQDYVYSLMSNLIKHEGKRFFVVLGKEDVEFKKFSTSDMNDIKTIYDVLDLLPNVTIIKKPTRIDNIFLLPFTFQNQYTKDGDIIIGSYNIEVPYDNMQLFGINNASYDYGLVIKKGKGKKQKHKRLIGINSHYNINHILDIDGSVVNNIAHTYKMYNNVILTNIGIYLDSHFLPFDSGNVDKSINDFVKYFMKSYVVDMIPTNDKGIYGYDFSATEINGYLYIDAFVINCDTKLFDKIVEVITDMFKHRLKINTIILYENLFNVNESELFTYFCNTSRFDNIIRKNDIVSKINAEGKPSGLVLLQRYANELIEYTKINKENSLVYKC